MHFEILGRDRTPCSVDLVKADAINIKRRPMQVFTFKDVESFVDALIGHRAVIVYVGKDPDSEEENWKAYYWEPSMDEAKRHFGYDESGILPPSSLAILEMEESEELQWELEMRQTNAREWIDTFNELTKITSKIFRIDDENEYANSNRFRFMELAELKEALKEAKEEYRKLTSRPEVEIGG